MKIFVYSNALLGMFMIIILCLLHLGLNAQDDVTIRKYRKFNSTILGGEITFLEHLTDGYGKSE